MFRRLKADFTEQVWNNEHVLKGRQKFAELDTQTQSYILIGSFAGFVLILLLTFFTLWARVITTKNDLARMDEQIRMTQNSSARIDELKAAENARRADPMLRDFDPSGTAESLAERVAQKSLIKKESVEVAGQKGGAELKLTKISIRQLVRALYFLEKGGSGASVDKLTVETKDDPEGYIWANLSLKKEN